MIVLFFCIYVMSGRPRVSKTALSQRLAIAAERSGLPVVASATDTKMRTLEAYLRGDSVPDAEFLRKFVEITGAHPSEILMGETRSGGSDIDAVALELNAPAFVDRLELQVSAGPGSSGDTIPIDPIPFSPHVLRHNSLRADELAVLEVRGDSMEPVLFAGDLVMVDKAPSKPVSGKMYVVARGSDVQIKWVTVMRSAIQLVSENEHYPPERVDPHDAPRFYRVRWFGHFIP